jgi:hypothetical protein
MSKDLSLDSYIKNDEIWKLYFDGAYSKEGFGSGVVLISPIEEKFHLSYKL